MASDDVVAAAISRCPFLGRVCREQGEGFARRFVADPRAPASSSAARQQRPAAETPDASVESLARFFHGPAGVVPLANFSASLSYSPLISGDCAKSDSVTEFSPASTRRSLGEALGLVKPAGSAAPAPSYSPMLSGAASISLSARFPWGPGDDARRRRPKINTASARNPGRGRSGGTGSRTAPAAASGTPPSGAGHESTAGRCPLRGLLGPLGGLIALPGKMKCPAPICAIRGAIAKTKAVKSLRPQALPVKFAAVSAFTAAVNVPCGAWRENFEKFSPGWFVAVHLTIPVVGMLRKAVGMPPVAVIITIAAAIAGQQIGAKLERYRRARHVSFTTFNPELAPLYSCCPVLPPLSTTPQNPDFAMELQPTCASWEMAASSAVKPLVLGVGTVSAATSAAKNAALGSLTPLSLSCPLSAY